MFHLKHFSVSFFRKRKPTYLWHYVKTVSWRVQSVIQIVYKDLPPCPVYNVLHKTLGYLGKHWRLFFSSLSPNFAPRRKICLCRELTGLSHVFFLSKQTDHGDREKDFIWSVHFMDTRRLFIWDFPRYFFFFAHPVLCTSKS